MTSPTDIPAPNWGPTGETVYTRTYQRTKPDGTRETWHDTVSRVARGNLELVYGPRDTWAEAVEAEYNELVDHQYDFRVIPAGRHLWASGVKGRQYLFNCHVAGWGDKISDHFEFTFLRLMEGGGVGANYSSRFLKPYGVPRRRLKVHVVCDPSHPDYADMLDAGVLSEEFTADWDGAYEIDDSREGWASALTDLIDTYWAMDVKHEDRVYDVTNVRAAGSRLKTFGGTASGPTPLARLLNEAGRILNGALDRFWAMPWEQESPAHEFAGHLTPLEAMEIDHAIAECVVSGGNRRSARMAMVEWDDPFIFDFIGCKADTAKHWTTNISVAIDDQFIHHLNRAHSADKYQTWTDESATNAALAGLVHDAVVKGMLANGEPGYWNRSLSQVGEVGEVVCTNPCGEITLQEWENCNLGHVNLQAFVDDTGKVDWAGAERAHVLMTRFLVRATYGDVNDPKQADTLAKNRRIGVGHLGVQGHLVKRGIRWTAAYDHAFGDELAEYRDLVRETARDYAFELRIPEPVKVTTVAPTGSIAKLPGVSEGIHPIYSRYFIRRVRFSTVDPDQYAAVQGYEKDGFKVEIDQYDPSGNTVIVEFPTKDNLVDIVERMGLDPSIVESADEISLDDMLAFQAMYQESWADNAVSFTANVPEGRYSVVEAAEVIRKWLPSLKGTTVMPDGTRPQAPYERITREAYEAATVTAVSDGIDEDCANGACPIR